MTQVPGATRTVRPAIRKIGIAAVIILFPVAAHSLWTYVEVRTLAREIEVIRSAGEPVSEFAAGYRPTKLNPEQQTAGRYFIAAALLASPGSSPRQTAVDALYEYAQGHTAAALNLNALRDQLSIAEREADALNLADKATSLQFAGFPPGTEYSYRTSELHALTRLLAARTLAKCLAHEGDAAARAAVAAIRAREVDDFFRRAEYQVPFLLSFCSPSTASLLALQKELQAQDQPNEVTDAVIRDRAAFIDRVIQHAYVGDSEMPALIRPKWTGFFAAVWRPIFTRRFVTMLRGWNELVAASRLPWPEKGPSMRAIYDRFPPNITQTVGSTPPAWRPGALIDSLLVMLPRRDEKRLVLDRASATAVAVQLYRRDHDGALPAALHDLVPRYLPSVPLDPATGGPLLLRTSGEAFSIYGVGQDRKDDGGDFTSDLQEVERRGWGVRALRGRDVGVRVMLNHSVDRVNTER